MPFTHKEIEDVLGQSLAEVSRRVDYRRACSLIEVRLNDDMAGALGSPDGLWRRTPYLAPVVDAIVAKLEVDDEKLRASKVRETKQIGAWLSDNHWTVLERDIFRAVVRDGETYVLVKWTKTGPEYVQRDAFDGACGADVIEQNGVETMAFNAWKGDDGSFYLDLFFPDRIEKYWKKDSNAQWEQRRDAPDEPWPVPWVDDAGQPLGIPIIEFCIGKSDLEDALQLARNLSEAELDMLAVSRTQGFPLRYLKGQRNPEILLNQEGQPLVSPITGKPFKRTIQFSPGQMMPIAAESELGQLDGAKTDTAVVDKILELLSYVTTVPTFVLRGSDFPSGVALIEAERRLNHKVEGHQGRLTTAIVTMLQLTMRLSNYFASTAFDAEQTIDIPWHPPQVLTEDLRMEQEQHTTDNVTKLFDAGLMSKETALRTLHPDWTDADVQAELARLETERQQAMDTMQQTARPVGQGMMVNAAA